MKQSRSFVVEIKSSRKSGRTKEKSSIWGSVDLKALNDAHSEEFDLKPRGEDFVAAVAEKTSAIAQMRILPVLDREIAVAEKTVEVSLPLEQEITPDFEPAETMTIEPEAEVIPVPAMLMNNEAPSGGEPVIPRSKPKAAYRNPKQAQDWPRGQRWKRLLPKSIQNR